VAWIREDALKNRFFFTTLIHSDAGAGSDFYHSLILRALEYAAGYRDPLSMGGSPMTGAASGARLPAFATSSRRIDVDAEGPFRLTLRSVRGETLYSVSGAGRQAFAPGALAQAGLYLVTLESRAGAVSRTVMAY
jgi:hypothetical protein